jgi:DNA-binding SARP family transcriptional activator
MTRDWRVPVDGRRTEGQHPPTDMGDVEVMVLGPVEAFRAGRPVDLGRPQQRALFGFLAVRLGTVVPVETLIDALWPDDPPASAEKRARRR